MTAISGEHMSTDQRVVKQRCSLGCTLVHMGKCMLLHPCSKLASASAPRGLCSTFNKFQASVHAYIWETEQA